MTGSWPTIAARRPPGLSCESSERGTSATEPERTITSNGPSTTSPAEASASITRAFSTQARFRFSLAMRASSGSISTVVTCCALCASSAAM